MELVPILCFDCGENKDKSVGGGYDGEKWVCLQCLIKNRQQLERTKVLLETARRTVDQYEALGRNKR